MAKTRLQLRTDARTELLEPSAARWSDDQLNRYLNDGQNDLAEVLRTKIRASVSVTSGTSSIPSPSNISVIYDIWWESGGTRSKVMFSNHPFEPDTQSSGIPVKAWLENGTLYFWPSAGSQGSLLIKGRQKPASMDDDTSTHGLPDDPTVDEALIAYCVWQAYNSDFDPQRDLWAVRYAMLKGRFAKAEAERNPQVQTVNNVYDDSEPYPLTPWDYL